MEKRLGRPTRDAYGQTLVELGRADSRIVVLDADLSKSTKTCEFAKVFPDRFFNVGIQEANMVGVAAGLAASGKIPFCSSFASFLICKSYDQLRMGVAFSEYNVKIVASHGGISVGEDGASQMSIEDIALVCSLPNFVVMVPADEFATADLVRASVVHQGPVYMRTCRPKAPIIYDAQSRFQIGEGVRLREGNDVTLVANGLLVFEALCAWELLRAEGIEAGVVDMHTVKPLDRELLLNEARKTGHLVVAEEHQVWGGLGSAVASLLSRECPVRIEFIGIQDTYAESGSPDQLLEKYGLTAPHMVQAAKRVLGKI
ncbi:MAG: transketolase family protein [Candidatus Omnitrophica bacterium]|nr:transketolase family protein [Candidatus Omnitrophota bacterium]